MHDIVFAVRVYPPSITERSPLATSVAPPVTGSSNEDDGAATRVPSSRRPVLIVTPNGTSIVK